MQHIINPHINDEVLIFLSVEIRLTGITRGLDAGWPFVPGVLLSPPVQRADRGSSAPAPVQTSGAEADTTTPVAHTRTYVTQPCHQCSTETSNPAK